MAEREELWTNATLVGPAGQVESAWFDVRRFDHLTISRNVAGGTAIYGFEIDWSRDRSTVDLTESVTVPEDDQVDQPIAAIYARFRVRNTGAGAFTAHRTNVFAVT